MEITNYPVENDSTLEKHVIMGSAGKVDPIEELFRRIMSLKDEYLSMLMELDQLYIVPNLTEGNKTEEFNNKVIVKETISETLKFLQVEKRDVHGSLMEKLPEYEAAILSLMHIYRKLAASLSADKRPQQQHAQPAAASHSFPINSPEVPVQREGAETLVAKNPFDRLRYAVRSSSPAALRSSVHSMWSVLRESDSVPFGAFLDSTSTQQLAGSSTMNKLKRAFEQSPLSGSMSDCAMPFEGDASGSESRVLKRQKMQNANYAVHEEIEAINSKLIDTEVTIARHCGTDIITSSCDADTTIKLSYTAVAISPELKSLFASSEKCVVMPAKLSVPPDYPSRSPILIVDNGDDQLRNKAIPISDTVHVAFPLALNNLPEPRSITDIARVWDSCVRTAVTDFAQQYGGGTFSSRFGPWERFRS